MSTSFYLPTENIVGENALQQSLNKIKNLGLKKVLIVTDKPLVELGYAKIVQDGLSERDIESVLFDGVQPNPTIENVEQGLAVYQGSICDSIVALGGGSPMDCAKGIALTATNSTDIRLYEGVDKSKFPQAPLIAINTTAGTASEITRFAIITDKQRKTKMAIVDVHVTPLISVNDPALMKNMPKFLTNATGMDALTHAVEAFVSTASTSLTDACAEKAFELISEHLVNAYNNGGDMEARNGMAEGQLLAGMAFNNASLGYVHGIAHQLGGMYDLPHGVCNAILLPHVQRFNLPSCMGKLAVVAEKLGVDVDGLGIEQRANAAIDKMEELSRKVEIPSGLAELGVREEDFHLLATNALKDACSATNPRVGSVDDIISILRAAM